MKCCYPLILLMLAATPGISDGQTLVDSSTDPNLFEPAGSHVTVNAPDSLIGLTIGGSASGPLGTYWDVEAQGGASLKLVVGLAETGAQVALTGDELEFNIANNDSRILGALGTGAGLGLSWSATATFDDLLLAPNTTYQLSFDVNDTDGLFTSIAGVVPQFGVELLDGEGAAVSSVSEGTLVDILGLQLLGIIGSPPEAKRAVVQFQTGSSVGDESPGSVRFTGSVVAPASLLGLGTEFASVSNLQIAVVPEPSVLGLASLGAFAIFRRRRAA